MYCEISFPVRSITIHDLENWPYQNECHDCRYVYAEEDKLAPRQSAQDDLSSISPRSASETVLANLGKLSKSSASLRRRLRFET